MPAFFEQKDDLWEILWFDRIYEKHKKMWCSHNQHLNFYSFWGDYDDFFENIFKYFVKKIIHLVEGYSKSINQKTELNNRLNEFLVSITNPLRCYTTNYDRLIPTVYKGEMFEGFSKIDETFKFDLKRVIEDNTSNIYYNLHGSVHYDLEWPNTIKYSPYNFIYEFSSRTSYQRDQDKKKLIDSNIITGFNKPARILTNPYSQFYLRFYQDCLTVNKIFIVGYSFSDNHINSAIKTALSSNKNLKIVCVDYMVYDEDINMEAENDWITLNGINRNFLDDTFEINIHNVINDKEDYAKISIYRKGFQRFLESYQWTKI